MMDNGFQEFTARAIFNRTIEPKVTKSPQAPSKRPSPITLRLTRKERAKLEELAQSMTLSAYIRMVLFAEDVAPRKSSKRAPVKDHEELAQVLALLGQSRIANNLNQLAKEAHLGSLIIDEQTKRQIDEACFHILDMRQHLIKALGLKS